MDYRAIFRQIAADAAGGDLVFPTHVGVALKVQRALDEPDCTLDQAAGLIVAEPMLATRVVAMANSVAYNRSGREITDVKAAVARLGFRTVRSLAIGLVVRQMSAGPTEPKLQAMATQLWQHTAHVAALARALARHVAHIDPETALFAGLIHEVAGFYLLSRAGSYPGLLADEADQWVLAWNEEGEALVGRAVIDVLSVPEAVREGIDAYWLGYQAMPPATLGDILLLADELSPVISPLFDPESHDDHHASVELALEDGKLSGILRESAEEVQSLTAVLEA